MKPGHFPDAPFKAFCETGNRIPGVVPEAHIDGSVAQLMRLRDKVKEDEFRLSHAPGRKECQGVGDTAGEDRQKLIRQLAAGKVPVRTCIHKAPRRSVVVFSKENPILVG
jgi:hypothetical protein